MDLLEKGIKNISLYEVKKQVRKAQNVVLNYSEMEAKVREATNNEPWGTSSKKMQEIADGTYNYREREEVVGMIFRRFTEKAANEWRQIYKALILLEYIIKHGSERFVDDARANMSLISMLKSFHYTDSQGRDQGINIRNRAKLLLALLNDDAKIRSERKKARDNAKKFGGVAGGASIGAYGHSVTSGGFGGASTERVFGDGGVYGTRFENQSGSGGSRDDFEEYDAAPSTGHSRRARRRREGSNSAGSGSSSSVAAGGASASAATPAAVPDLFSFDDDTTTAVPAASTAAADDDDDFDDFQSAAPATTATVSAPAAPATSTLANLNALYAAPQQQHQQPQQSNSSDLFGLGNISSAPASTNNGLSGLNGFGTATNANYNTPSYTSTAASTSASNDAFSSLFSTAKATTATVLKPASKPVAETKASDDLFSSFTSAPAPATGAAQKQSNELDLLSL